MALVPRSTHSCPDMPGQIPPTRQKWVEPGVTTGIYYITFANLPFNLTWQRLKALISQVCDVDYVQLFPGSTSGWVRLQGKPNFEKAWNRLNGGDLLGRRVIACDKNRYQHITIKVPVHEEYYIGYYQPNTVGSLADGGTPKGVARQTCDCHHNFRSIGMHASAQQTHSLASMPPQPTQPDNMRSMWTAPDMVFNNSRSGYFSGTDAWFPTPNVVLTNEVQTGLKRAGTCRVCACSGGHSGSAIEPATPIDPRKRIILIKQFTLHAKESEIRLWISRLCGPLQKNIRQIYIPRKPRPSPSPNSSSHETRGHAYIVCRSALVAAGAANLLQNKVFRGRGIRTRLLNDDAVRFLSSQSRGTQRDKKLTLNHRLQSGATTAAVTAQTVETKENNRKGSPSPVVVNGSTCNQRIRRGSTASI